MEHNEGPATSVTIDVHDERGTTAGVPATTPAEDLSSYKQDLEASTRDSYEDFEGMGFLSISGRELQGRRLVLIIGKLLPASTTSRERLKKYVMHKLHPIVSSAAYSILFVNTDATFQENSPGVLWLRSTFESLPSMYRSQLGAVYCLHPTLGLRLMLATVAPWMSQGLWHKLVYVSRVEFLSEHVAAGQVALPDFVLEHDQELEGRPLMDYGVEADGDQAAMLRSAAEAVPELREPLGVYHGAG